MWNSLEIYEGKASTQDLQHLFPAYGNENLMVFPHGMNVSLNWFFPSDDLWSPPATWSDISFLLDAMCTSENWQDFETTRRKDPLREYCMVHHFHIESSQKIKQRSGYRWFAFRDPKRLGNVWYNLGGTYTFPKWTSSTWMARICELYPWIASIYRIRDITKIPIVSYSPANVRYIWKNEPSCYPVVRVENQVYLCAGDRAQKLILNDIDDSSWMVFITPEGLFAKLRDSDNVIEEMADAADIADRLKYKSNNKGVK